jgi:hypothetical protein
VKTGEIGSDRLSKSASWLWLTFKIGELALAGFQNWQVGSGWLSKLVSWFWPAFKIGKLALAGFQNRQFGSGRLSKALGAGPRNLLSGAKDLSWPVFKSFSQIQKLFALNG